MMLDVRSRAIVIVGGGAVAARKGRGLLDAGAGNVRCVATTFSAEFPDGITRVHEPYRPQHLDGASVVFAATNSPEVNAAVVRDAHARNVLICRADSDDEDPGDFSTPATLRRGEVIITVSSASPALSVRIRDRIEENFDPMWEQMAAAMLHLRPMIKASGLEVAARGRILRELAGDEALGVLRERGLDGLRLWLRQRHPELKDA